MALQTSNAAPVQEMHTDTTVKCFLLGAVSYLVFATVSWIGTIIWRVHATSSHSHR